MGRHNLKELEISVVQLWCFCLRGLYYVVFARWHHAFQCPFWVLCWLYDSTKHFHSLKAQSQRNRIKLIKNCEISNGWLRAVFIDEQRTMSIERVSFIKKFIWILLMNSLNVHMKMKLWGICARNKSKCSLNVNFVHILQRIPFELWVNSEISNAFPLKICQ